MTNEQLLNIATLGSTGATMQAAGICEEKFGENPFKSKWYRVRISDSMDMEFAIMLETAVAALPVYLDISKCTNPMQLIYDLMSTPNAQLRFHWVFCTSDWKEYINKCGYFGKDFRLYERLVIDRRFVPRDYADLADVEKALETLELIEHKD